MSWRKPRWKQKIGPRVSPPTMVHLEIHRDNVNSFVLFFRTISFCWECFLNVNFDSKKLTDWLYFHICSFSKKREPQPSLITRSEADQSRGWQTLWERFYVSIMNTVFFLEKYVILKNHEHEKVMNLIYILVHVFQKKQCESIKIQK